MTLFEEKTMRLNELLSCVRLDVAQFKNYKRRDQLPFMDREQFSVPPGEKLHSRWTDYTLEDALRLQVMVNLSDYKSPDKAKEPEISKRYDGLPPMAASAIAQNSIGNACAKYGGLAGILAQPKDIWHVTTVDASMYEGELWYGSEHFAGSLVECAERIEDRKEHQVRAILFNVTSVLRAVIEAGKLSQVSDVLDFAEKNDA
ncbi:MAG: hypothetical protein ABF308_14100 [Phaeobacter gallaeciensis]